MDERSTTPIRPSSSNKEIPEGLSVEAYRDYYEKSSPEEKVFLEKECRPLLECSSCGEVFYSVAFFIAHKRTYCREIPGMELQDSRKHSSREALIGAKIGRQKKRGPKADPYGSKKPSKKQSKTTEVNTDI